MIVLLANAVYFATLVSDCIERGCCSGDDATLDACRDMGYPPTCEAVAVDASFHPDDVWSSGRNELEITLTAMPHARAFRLHLACSSRNGLNTDLATHSKLQCTDP
eukprot:6213587-Pleurochrysis_carterae.AAC.1